MSGNNAGKPGRSRSDVFNPKGSTASMRRDSTFNKLATNDPAIAPVAPQSWAQKQCAGLKDIFLQPINLLLIFVPLGIAAGKLEWGALPTFSCNFMAIVPLAAVLGAATEALASHTGQLLGGLLNATFGNAVEMIVTVNAIRAGFVQVVQQSLIGSILSNLLLVLGMAFVAAGMVASSASFNKTGAGTNISCLVLSSLALTLPTVFSYIPNTEVEDSVNLSRVVAIVMGFVYVAFLVFQLRTHADLFSGQEEEAEGGAEELLSPGTAAGLLFATTCAVAYCSEFLVDSIEGVSDQYGLPYSFIGLILLPIVGNAAEHTTAVTVAFKGKMDLALGVAVGSSTQIALFVVPFSVIVGWAYGVPMTLNFEAFDTTVFLLSVFIASGILGDGETNWFEGIMLISTYLIVAIITWYIPEAKPAASEANVARELSELGIFSTAPPSVFV